MTSLCPCMDNEVPGWMNKSSLVTCETLTCSLQFIVPFQSGLSTYKGTLTPTRVSSESIPSLILKLDIGCLMGLLALSRRLCLQQRNYFHWGAGFTEIWCKTKYFLWICTVHWMFKGEVQRSSLGAASLFWRNACTQLNSQGALNTKSVYKLVCNINSYSLRCLDFKTPLSLFPS